MKSTKALLVTAVAFFLLLSISGCSAATAKNQTLSSNISYTESVISYLGPEGTYTQEACFAFFDHNGTYLPYTTVGEAVQAVIDGETDFAVIPQENTIGGAVIDYVDTLISQETLSIIGEVELPINQNLLVLPGTALENVETVYSHKQGIAQGKAWLEENLPAAEIIEVSSTAEGARMVSEAGNPSCAAIASAACAEVYGLEVLASGIQNNDSNKTRFYVLSPEAPLTIPADRLAFIAIGDADDLPALMSKIEKLKIKLVTIHDRPLKTELGEYYYLIECTDCSYKDFEKLSKNSLFQFRYLGSFNAK